MLQLLKEFRNVEEYETFDENNTGEMSLRMQTSSFSDVDNIQLNSLLLKNVGKEYASNKLIAFEKIHKPITDRISEVKSNLSQAKLTMQKNHGKLVDQLKFATNNVYNNLSLC